ncbi:MAG: hypothetical protein J3K34DRAFT_410966 [Monoraphidium minutum]|nr:MAG: hypothetical protein J3K34DRAFT_410966 [Monoraphidium minutum]
MVACAHVWPAAPSHGLPAQPAACRATHLGAHAALRCRAGPRGAQLHHASRDGPSRPWQSRYASRWLRAAPHLLPPRHAPGSAPRMRRPLGAAPVCRQRGGLLPARAPHLLGAARRGLPALGDQRLERHGQLALHFGRHGWPGGQERAWNTDLQARGAREGNNGTVWGC